MEQNPTQRLAQTLFFQTDKTQKEIASMVGVSEKTIYLWMKQGDWKRLRSASRLMPSMIVENFLSQVQELNDEIRTRDQGKRYPTIQEAETFRKMVVTIGRIQKGHTQGEYMEMMQKFLTFLLPLNHELVKTLTGYANDFLKSRAVEGFTPFDTGYLPTDPFEEETLNSPPYFQGGVPAELGDALAGGGGSPLAPDNNQKDRHPEFISGPYANTEKAEENPEPQPEKPATTRNYTETLYGISIKPFSESTPQKPETANEPVTGNLGQTETPSGAGVHIPGLNYRTPDGELKPIPPYQSKEYYDIPLYLRERLYDMSGQPIKDRIVSRYF